MKRLTLPVLATVMFVTACATATIDTAVPQGADTAPMELAPETAVPDDITAETAVTDDAAPETPGTEAGEPAALAGEPIDTGTFPNLNEVQRGQVAQMSAEERAAFLEQLAAARAEQEAAGSTTGGGTAAELERLKQTHVSETLKEIEGE